MPGTVPLVIRLQGYIIIGGITLPEAETHDTTVESYPFHLRSGPTLFYAQVK